MSYDKREIIQEFAKCCRTIYAASEPSTRSILDFAVGSSELPLIYSAFVHALLAIGTISSRPGAESAKAELQNLDLENLVDVLGGNFRCDYNLFMSVYDSVCQEIENVAVH